MQLVFTFINRAVVLINNIVHKKRKIFSYVRILKNNRNNLMEESSPTPNTCTTKQILVEHFRIVYAFILTRKILF